MPNYNSLTLVASITPRPVAILQDKSNKKMKRKVIFLSLQNMTFVMRFWFVSHLSILSLHQMCQQV